MKPKKLKIINQEGEKISLKIAFFLNLTVAPIVCLQFRMQTNNKRSLMNLIKKAMSGTNKQENGEKKGNKPKVLSLDKMRNL